MRGAALLVLVTFAGGCADGGVPPAGDDAGPADASVPDARPPAIGDSLPLGSISFFSTPACPAGWVPFDAGAGRFFVPTTGTTLPGSEHGTPLASGEDRVHTHGVGASVETGSVSYVGVAGCCNGGVAPSGTYGF